MGAAVPRRDNYIVMQELPNKPRRGPPKKKDVMPLVEKGIKSGSLIMTDGLKCCHTLVREHWGEIQKAAIHTVLRAPRAQAQPRVCPPCSS